MTRDAEGYLAGVCAEYRVDRLALAGVVAVRNASWIGGGDVGAGAAAFQDNPVLPQTALCVFRDLESRGLTSAAIAWKPSITVRAYARPTIAAQDRH